MTSALGCALAAVVLWSLNARAAATALEHLSVLQVLALQFAAAFSTVLGVRLASGSRMPRVPVRTLALAVMGVAGTIGLQYLAFATAPLVAANAIAYSWPLLVAARRGPFGFALVGFTGVVLVLAAHGGGEAADAPAPALGYVAALGSAFCMAAFTLGARSAPAGTSDLLLIGCGAGALLACPAAILAGDAWVPAASILVALAIGVAIMAAGYGLWTLAMSTRAGPRLAPVAYATPLLSTGVLLATGEALAPLGWVGCALIAGSTLAVVAEAVRDHCAVDLAL